MKYEKIRWRILRERNLIILEILHNLNIFFQGFCIAIPITIIIIFGFQRNWLSGIRRCNYMRFRNTQSNVDLNEDFSL